MSHSIDLKEDATKLRKKGFSIKEISKKLDISVSTSSLWLSNIILSTKAQERLRIRKILGQYKAVETNKKKRIALKKQINLNSDKSLKQIRFNKDLYKLICSIFFWTEGGKYTDSYVYFMNSDPLMIATFMKLLRSSFKIDEAKLRVLIHAHDYHHIADVERYWSTVTQISLSQFNKTYLKTNTKKRIREGYQGCVRIRYYDAKIALELRSSYNAFTKYLGVSVNGKPVLSKSTTTGSNPVTPAKGL